jgi:hypothetical protein
LYNPGVRLAHHVIEPRIKSEKRDIVRGALRDGSAAFVIDLRRGGVAVAEEFLHLRDVDLWFEQ